MSKVQAFVLKDGQAVFNQLLQKYSLKDGDVLDEPMPFNGDCMDALVFR